MKKIYLLSLFSIVLLSTSAFGQDTCKVYSVKNPHGAAMSINKIWVLDSVNFSVESIKPTPFQLGASESFSIKVCILARDGASHSTQVRYTNTHGTSSYNVTMVAPSGGAASVQEVPVEMVLSVSPNPASSYLQVSLNTDKLKGGDVAIYNMIGEQVQRSPIEAETGTVFIDVSAIPSGRYMAVITSEGRQIAMSALVVEH